MLEKLGLAAALFKVRVLGRRLPFFVGWNLTFRCDLSCRYCGASSARGPELDAAGVCAGLDALWGLGARWVTFGGGEPLLRADIGEIVTHAVGRGYQVFLSTNGSLAGCKADVVGMVQHVNLSLDGPEPVHDAVRGAGAYGKTMAAVEVCRARGVPFSFQCTMSSENLGHVEAVARLAAGLKSQVMFQPATQWLDSSTSPNPIAPEPGAYREAMDQVVALKRAGLPVRNSYTGLRHLRQWPEPAKIWCPAGALACEIEPDGSLVACHQAQVGLFLEKRCGGGGFDEKFRNAVIPRGCAQCWCAPLVELALVFSLRPEAIYNALRISS